MLYDLVREDGINVKELAVRLGVSGSAVGQVLHGRFAPSLRTMEKFANALGYRVVVSLEPIEPQQEGGGGE